MVTGAPPVAPAVDGPLVTPEQTTFAVPFGEQVALAELETKTAVGRATSVAKSTA